MRSASVTGTRRELQLSAANEPAKRTRIGKTPNIARRSQTLRSCNQAFSKRKCWRKRQGSIGLNRGSYETNGRCGGDCLDLYSGPSVTHGGWRTQLHGSSGSSGSRSSSNMGGSNSSRNNGGWGRQNSPNNGGWQNNGGSQNNGGWQNNNGWQRNSQGTNNGYGGWNQQSSPNTNGGWTGGYQGGRQTNSYSQSKSGPSGNKMNVVPFSGSNKSANSSNQQTVMKPVQPGSGGFEKAERRR